MADISKIKVNNTNYNIKDSSALHGAATASAYGGIKIGYTQSGHNYPIQLDSNGKAYVNVPSSGGGGGDPGMYWTMLYSEINGEDWDSCLSNWQLHDSYSQYEYLVFIVKAGDTECEVVWVPTSMISDNGYLEITWSCVQSIGGGGMEIHHNVLEWPGSWDGSIYDGSAPGTRGIQEVTSSSQSYREISIANYTDCVLEIWGVSCVY